MDEARKIEQDVLRKKEVRIPKKILLIGGEKLTRERKRKVDELLIRHPSLKGFYWAKEKISAFYRQESRKEAAKLLILIILNLKPEDDGALIR
jgi:hypothetical protein